MLSLAIALPLSLFIWLCSVAILSMAISTGALAGYRLLWSLNKGWQHVAGALLGVAFWGGFALVVGTGALDLGAGVVDGIISRVMQ